MCPKKKAKKNIFYLNILTPEDQTYTLSRNVANKATRTAQQKRKAKISVFTFQIADGKRDAEPNDSCRSVY